MDNLEKRLYQYKWYDYRLDTPYIANLRFIYSYLTEYQNFMRYNQARVHATPMTNYNWRRNPKTNKFVKFKTIKKNSKTKVSILDPYDLYNTWQHYDKAVKLRQYCDSQKMTYPDFWAFGFQTLQLFKFRQFTLAHIARESVIKNIIKIEKEVYANKIKQSKLEYFTASKWNNEKLQRDYYQYLITAVKAKYKAKSIDILDLLVEEGLLHPDYLQCQI